MLTIDLREQGVLGIEDITTTKYLCTQKNVSDVELILTLTQLYTLKSDLAKTGFWRDAYPNIDKLFGMSFKVEKALR